MTDDPFADALASVLDSAGVSCALVSQSGRRERRWTSCSFQKMLAAEPRHGLVERAVEEIADTVNARTAARDPDATLPTRPLLLSDKITTRKGTYRFYATCFNVLRSGAARLHALVVVTPPAVDPLNEDVLSRRFGLTPREAELAALLARGRTNARIADAMGISPHTAHHYTERVLLKVGAANRTEAGARILTVE